MSSDDDIEYMSRVPYSGAAGSLMHWVLFVDTWLILTKSIGKLFSGFFRYLWGTSGACLQFGKSRDGLVDYVDSDYAGDLDKRRSLTGYISPLVAVQLVEE